MWVPEVDGLQKGVKLGFKRVVSAGAFGNSGGGVFVVVSVDAMQGVNVVSCPFDVVKVRRCTVITQRSWEALLGAAQP